MKNIVMLALIALVLIPLRAFAYTADDMAAANRFYDEKSYQLAANEFEKLLAAEATPALKREVLFKWSDSALKAKMEDKRETAEKNLREMADGKGHDRWWAEAGVSISQHLGERDPWSNRDAIRGWLDNARDWWAGSSDVDLAREKFISISFQLADVMTKNWGWYNVDIRPIRLGEKSIAPAPSQQGNMGLQVLFEEILKVAKTDEDKAHAHYGLGMSYMQDYSGDEKRRQKAVAEFEAVIDDFEKTEWADDAWYQLGTYYENKADYVKAVSTYKDYLKHFKAGESQWVDDVKRKVEYITNPTLSVSASNTFVPESEVQFGLNWRNIDKVKITLYRFDMTEELKQFPEGSGLSDHSGLLHHMVEKTARYTALPVETAWEIDLNDDGKHVPKSEYKGMAEWRKGDPDDKADPKAGVLPAGAYLMVATGGGQRAYDLVLVSDLALVTKVAKDKAVFVTVDAKTGKPAAGAKLRYIYSYYDANNNTKWEQGEAKSGDDGLAVVALKNESGLTYYQQHSVFAAVTSGARQAFVSSNFYNNYYNSKGEWWLYAFTDRPAYRPTETVSFKGILRRPDKGAFANPAGMKVKARIYNAQGTQVKEGDYTLNDYGAFDDTLVLDEKAVLGAYTLQLYNADNNNQISSAQLFQLEEYKLPEYTVSVKAKPKSEKGPAVFRLGDTLEMEVDAQYYFGGAVADAQVEYLVYQKPLFRYFRPYRAYHWYYEDMYPQHYSYGNGSMIKTEKLKTGKDGKVTFKVETPKDGQDQQYHVEVRVVDQSRREIRGTADIKVTKNAFFATLEAQQNIYRPGDKAQVTIKTLTANDEPMAVEGKVSVMRNTWREAIINDGRETTPAGYNGQEMFTKFVKTNDRGEAVFEFEPGANGYYTLEFTGFDDGREVKGAVNVFVCDNAATNIGYRYSGLQIIAEKDTYAEGDTARVMLVADKPDTWALFTVEADGIYDYRMVHIEGSVKMLDVKVADNFVPNVFLSAAGVEQFQLKMNSLQLIVPPRSKFLNVTASSDKAVYQPQEEGVFDVKVTDADGKPVSAEISLGLVDASVYYIQSELAPDIRQFFYGEKRQLGIQTQASFYQRPYVKLVRGDNNELMTDDEKLRRGRVKDKNGYDGPVDAMGDMRQAAGNAMGGMREDGAMRMQAMPSSAPAPMMAKSVAKEGMMAADEVSGNEQEKKKRDVSGLKTPQQGEDDGEAPAVRNDFRSTVIWQPSVKTDAEGKARVTVKYPDSLTTWKLTARAVTTGTAIGSVTHEVKSNKDLMVRLQAPRFFTERDLVAVSALIDNMTDAAVTVQPAIKVEGGLVVTGLYQNGQFVKGELGPVEIPARGQKRVDWAVAAQTAGKATITVTAGKGKMADAMQKTYPVIPHGIEKFVAQSLAMKNGGTKEIKISIPKERIKEATSLRLSLSPSMAANLLDALPYLADYPYGCVEQTMSRFLPAVIVGKTMKDLGISDSEVEGYISDVLEARGDPKGHPQRRADATYTRLKQMTGDGLQRLYDFQHADGGWGWWKDGDSDRFMTAYVVWGMSLARDAGVPIRDGVILNAARFLHTQLVEEEDNPDSLAWMLHALSGSNTGTNGLVEKQRERLWNMRDKLNPYTRALYAIAEKKFGNHDRAATLARNVINGVSEDKDNGTAHWGESGVHYRWSEGGVESTAFSISALAQLDPQSVYLEPAVKWLTLNRRGGSWKNTRDTAIAILGLTEYLKASKELSPSYAYKVTLNGTTVREGKVDAGNVFTFNRNIDIPADQLRDGDNVVTVTMDGTGALYMAAYAKYFTLEEPITKAGNEIFVTRKYFIQSVKETLMKGYTNDWKELKDGQAVNSGDRIRVDVTMEAKNHYEYLVAEDYKPAGLEAVELKSGPGYAVTLDSEGRETGEQTSLYQEFRDQKAAFFISKLKQGKHLIRYELRAEIPGKFHAMPNQSHAMYVPEIRASSDEMRLDVNEAPAEKGSVKE